MIEIKADLWTYPADYRCVTTNGIVMKNGELVMGAGIALDAKLRYPEVPKLLGECVKKYGNIPFMLTKQKLISFPTKNDWKDKSDIDLIERSAKRISEWVKDGLVESVITGRPGCGLGGLNWEDVKIVIEPYFNSDKFIVCYN